MIDLVIVGGGPAGLAAAYSAWQHGLRDILILERDNELGGILNQCIHNGFGLHRFGEQLTGPEYAGRCIELLRSTGVRVELGTMVLEVTPDKKIPLRQPGKGLSDFGSQKHHPLHGLPGAHPRCHWHSGYPPCRYLHRRCGPALCQHGGLSGRQAGAHPRQRRHRPNHGPPHDAGRCQSTGLRGGHAVFRRPDPQHRAVLQDFDIPLYLSHTIVDIQGKARVEKATVARWTKTAAPSRAPR